MYVKLRDSVAAKPSDASGRQSDAWEHRDFHLSALCLVIRRKCGRLLFRV